MLENRFVVGVLIGLPISVIGVVYTLLRRDYVVAAMRAADPGASPMSDQAAFLSVLGGFAMIAPMIGLMSGMVFGWLSPTAFTAVTLGLGALMTLAALLTRTPLMVEKVLLNALVMAGYGLLLPRLLGA
jgi:hypothetical protein